MSGELKELQRRMAAAVMQPLTRKETMVQRRKDGVRMEEESSAFIKPNDRLSSFERLEIYNRQYWFRLYTSFEEDFPGVQAVVGRAKFEGLMRAYLTECPSESFSLRNLGSRLPAWLAAHTEWTEPRTQLALDMARLEWAHIEVFDEAALPVTDAGGFVAGRWRVASSIAAVPAFLARPLPCRRSLDRSEKRSRQQRHLEQQCERGPSNQGGSQSSGLGAGRIVPGAAPA